MPFIRKKNSTWILSVAYLIQNLRSVLCLGHRNLCCFTYRTYLVGGPMFYKNLKDVYKPNGMQSTTHLACYLYNLCDTFKKLIWQIKHLRLQTTKREKKYTRNISYYSRKLLFIRNSNDIFFLKVLNQSWLYVGISHPMKKSLYRS